MKIFVWIVVVAVVIGGAWWLMSKNPVEAPSMEEEDHSATTPPSESTSTENNEPPTVEIGGSGSVVVPVTKIFNVAASSFRFDPAEIRVKKGDTVRIVLKNSGGMHDWKLDEFKAATKVLQAGQSETIEFVASKAGTFEYYCSVGTHRQMGMVGKLIVSE